jgi:hypothetical protein
VYSIVCLLFFLRPPPTPLSRDTILRSKNWLFLASMAVRLDLVLSFIFYGPPVASQHSYRRIGCVGTLAVLLSFSLLTINEIGSV